MLMVLTRPCAQAKGRDGEAERVLLEDVQESIADMVQIMQSYKNKNMVSKVFVSTLCKRRQEEAEAAINSAIQRLQVRVRLYNCFLLKKIARVGNAHMFVRSDQATHKGPWSMN